MLTFGDIVRSHYGPDALMVVAVNGIVATLIRVPSGKVIFSYGTRDIGFVWRNGAYRRYSPGV